MFLKRAIILSTILVLAACGDGVTDDSLDDAMVRESMCIVASERFLLYDEARTLLEHGLDFGHRRFNRTHEPNDFREQVHKVREFMDGMSKDFNASFLSESCNRNVTVGEFKRV